MSQPPAGGLRSGSAEPLATEPAATGQPGEGTAPAGLRAGLAAAAARILPVAVPPAVMVVLGIWGLARHSSMGNDEIATQVAALLSMRELGHLLIHVDAVHGLYYLLMHAWVAVGSSPAALRVPSVIAMAAATALASVLARRLTGSGWAGLWAGLVMALTPSISYYAQTARSYAMVVACLLAATLALLRAIAQQSAAGDQAAGDQAGGSQAEHPRRRVARAWLVYGALMVVAGYLNEMALLALCAHAVTVLLARRPGEVFGRWAKTAALVLLAVAPLALLSAKEDVAIGWLPPPGLAGLQLLGRDYFGTTITAVMLVVAFSVIALLPGRDLGPPTGSERRSMPWWRSGGVTVPSVALPLLVIPASVLILESLAAKPLYIDRYVLYGEAGAALLAGAGMHRLGRYLREKVPGWPALAAVPAAAACLGLLVFQFGPQREARTPDSRLYDFGGPARYVGAKARPGDAVLFFNTFYRKIRLGYPADFTRTDDIGQALSPVRAGTFRGTDLPFSAVRPLILQRSRIWVIGFAPSPSLPSGLLRQQSLLLENRFTQVSERHFKNIVVTLWRRA